MSIRWGSMVSWMPLKPRDLAHFAIFSRLLKGASSETYCATKMAGPLMVRMVAAAFFFLGRLIAGLVVDESKVEDVDVGGAEGDTRREGKASSNAASRVKIYCRMAQRIEQPIQLDEN